MYYRAYVGHVSQTHISTRGLRYPNMFEGGVIVANIKSAKKRILVINTKTERNKAIRSKVKTYVKKVYQAIEAGDKNEAAEALRVATGELNRACTKGIYHKNTVSRKISRLAAAVNKMA